MPFSEMIKLKFLKLCRIKSIRSIKIFFSLILKFIIIITFLKKDNMEQDIARVKNEKKKKKKGE